MYQITKKDSLIGQKSGHPFGDRTMKGENSAFGSKCKSFQLFRFLITPFFVPTPIPIFLLQPGFGFGFGSRSRVFLTGKTRRDEIIENENEKQGQKNVSSTGWVFDNEW